MPSDFHRLLLSSDGMALCHAALVAGVEALIHASSVLSLDAIKSEGLRPMFPGGQVPGEVIEAMKNPRPEIACFSLFPKPRPIQLHKDGTGAFKVAVLPEDFPRRPGLDWSQDYTWGFAENLRNAAPEAEPTDVFMRVVRDRYIVASYNPVPAKALRVCAKGLVDRPPRDWPELLKADVKDIHIFEPDEVQGYVWV